MGSYAEADPRADPASRREAVPRRALRTAVSGAVLSVVVGAFVGALMVAVLMAASAAHAAPAPSCPTPSGGALRYAPGAGKTVALTFDDGPGRTTTQTMDVLRRAGVTATFFNLGVHEREQPDLVRRERAAGYALGDHTWDHRDLTKLSAAQQAAELDRERAAERSLTGADPCLFRPPGGAYNATTLQLAQARHMQVWTWSVDTEDWKAGGSTDLNWTQRIRARAEAGASLDHPVILMHNQMKGNPATVAVLPAIIDFYKAHGYRFVNLAGGTGSVPAAAPAPSVAPPTTAAAQPPSAGGSNGAGSFQGIAPRARGSAATAANAGTAGEPPIAARRLLAMRAYSPDPVSGAVISGLAVAIALSAFVVHSARQRRRGGYIP